MLTASSTIPTCLIVIVPIWESFEVPIATLAGAWL
jgi:hypothetical protein